MYVWLVVRLDLCLCLYFHRYFLNKKICGRINFLIKKFSLAIHSHFHVKNWGNNFG